MRPIDYFDTAVEAHANRAAIIDGDVVLSYQDLASLSARIATIVETVNGTEALPIAIWSPNDYRSVATTLGVMRAGGVVMPLHTRNNSEQVGRYLRQLDPRAVFYHSSLAPAVRTARHLAGRRRWICLDAAIDGDPSLDVVLDGCDEYIDKWGDPFANPDRPVFVRQTSGTTGTPKVVIGDIKSFAISHLAFHHRLAASVGNEAAPVCLVAAPFSHAAGLHGFAMLTLGAVIILLREFNFAEILASIPRHKVTHMWLPASALNLLLSDPALGTFDFSSLRQILIGASAASQDKLRDAVSAFGPCIAVHYGQIEAGFLTWFDEKTLAAAAQGDRPERLLSSGTTMHVGRVAIMDDDGRLLSRGERGEIVVRGTSVKPYMTSLRESDAVEMALSKTGGWHHTGDVGYVDADGYLYVVGRKKDMVITGGFKIAAAEVERAIMQLSEIADCAVIGVPDPLRGEAVKAIVTTRHGASITDVKVLAHCHAKLGRLNSPTSVEQWDDLPRTAVGKIDKRKIREQFWAGLSRRVN